MNFALPLKPAQLWQRHPRETAAAIGFGLAALVAVGGTVAAMPTLGGLGKPAEPVAAEAPPVPTTSATQLRDLAPEEALKLNAELPVTGQVGRAAAAFHIANYSVAARTQALECMTQALYYEAGQESDEGQRAVAQVILNRVRHPAYPNSVCGVVYEGSTRQSGCQFTFTCDGSLARGPMAGAWNRAKRNANAMLNGAVYAPVGQATHYHANYVLPYWAASLTKTQVVGAHLFYRWAGSWGQPGAFNQAYSGREGSAAALRAAALAVPHIVPKALIAGREAVAALDAKAGVEINAAKGGRVTAHFSPEARAAVEKVKVVPYVERVSASDNLRYALDGGEPVGTTDKPLGRPTASNANASPAS